MLDLTKDELTYLRFLRRNCDEFHRFSVRIVDGDHVNLEFRALKDLGCIANTMNREFMAITPKGLAALRAARLADEQAQEAEHQRQQELARQERREQEAVLSQQAQLDQQTKQQFKHDWLIAVFELVGGFVLGLVVEHFVNILDKVSAALAAAVSLFH